MIILFNQISFKSLFFEDIMDKFGSGFQNISSVRKLISAKKERKTSAILHQMRRC